MKIMKAAEVVLTGMRADTLIENGFHKFVLIFILTTKDGQHADHS
jgi:hypothetical protein